MSKIGMLRLLINQRLTAAAEEIFDVFGRTIAEYEQELSRSKLVIERQRRLLELSKKPEVSLQADSSAISEQQDWSSSSMDLEKEESAIRIKEEEVDQDAWSDQPVGNSVSFVLFKNNSAEMQQENNSTGIPDSKFQGQDVGDSDVDPQPGNSVQQTCSDRNEDQPAASGNSQHESVDVARLKADSYICTICGQVLYQRSQWAKHMRIHRKVGGNGDKSFTCDICGKRLTRFDGYQKHLRVHTGEKPYSCHVCGRNFSDNSNYKRHMRRHTREKPLQSSG